jgi:hypothetical protein
MAGEAKTTDFLLSTATLMVGPSAKVMELNPAQHSLGLIKNVAVSSDPQFTELTQGVDALVVASVATGTQSKIAGEVYEYTARNIAYGAGIDASGSGFDADVKSYALATAIPNTLTSTVPLEAGKGADFAVDDWVVIQDTNVTDRVHVGKVASKATDTLTLAAGYAIPAGQAFAIATTVIYRVKAIGVGGAAAQPTYGIKLVGLLPSTGEPVTIVFPKVKVTKGISLSFQTDNFSNMPFEFTPYALVPADPYYSDFGRKQFMILKR